MDDMDANILIFNADTEGRVKLTDEEKETFVSEGLPIPNRIPLTKLSAQESRRKKKEVEACNSENSILQQKVDSLETTVSHLKKEALDREKNFTAERQKAFRDNAKPYMERFNGLRIKSRD
ncbi:Cyclic AMP-responsive element-binding protein 3-like protein 1 [Acropora cervicornis]|uniref:Cyclic AMP-responsive element-binding protein 3-like protein 1 n=1 Tax=Acropora cervicornis TaxID=6130 RepID=A0AAD9R4C1_ACRCE|nr:Cyclic AMP-responsive element-binding protein 3-like protein 1 [Acropora cervicornis]